MDIQEFLEMEIPFIGIKFFNIISAIIILVVGYVVINYACKYIKKMMIKANLTKILADFTSKVVKILLLFFLVGIALGSLGIDIGAVLISASVVSGFVLGFAVKDTLGNIASGFMIAITKPFKVGDSVTIAKITGRVTSVGASVTTLITPDNERVIIPNSKVWGNPITNKTWRKKENQKSIK